MPNTTTTTNTTGKRKLSGGSLDTPDAVEKKRHKALCKELLSTVETILPESEYSVLEATKRRLKVLDREIELLKLRNERLQLLDKMDNQARKDALYQQRDAARADREKTDLAAFDAIKEGEKAGQKRADWGNEQRKDIKERRNNEDNDFQKREDQINAMEDSTSTTKTSTKDPPNFAASISTTNVGSSAAAAPTTNSGSAADATSTTNDLVVGTDNNQHLHMELQIQLAREKSSQSKTSALEKLSEASKAHADASKAHAEASKKCAEILGELRESDDKRHMREDARRDKISAEYKQSATSTVAGSSLVYGVAAASTTSTTTNPTAAPTCFAASSSTTIFGPTAPCKLKLAGGSLDTPDAVEKKRHKALCKELLSAVETILPESEYSVLEATKLRLKVLDGDTELLKLRLEFLRQVEKMDKQARKDAFYKKRETKRSQRELTDKASFDALAEAEKARAEAEKASQKRADWGMKQVEKTDQRRLREDKEFEQELAEIEFMLESTFTTTNCTEDPPNFGSATTNPTKAATSFAASISTTNVGSSATATNGVYFN